MKVNNLHVYASFVLLLWLYWAVMSFLLNRSYREQEHIVFLKVICGLWGAGCLLNILRD